MISKGGYSYCYCKPGPTPPGPPPSPPPGGDTWDNYQVAGMNVLSVTGGKDKSAYDKVVIMLHGGGGSGSNWVSTYESGWFGNLTGFKYVFCYPVWWFSSHRVIKSTAARWC